MDGVTYIKKNITQLLTPIETAAILGVTKSTLEVWRATKRYDLSFVKIGGRVMYKREDIEDFISRRSVSCAG